MDTEAKLSIGDVAERTGVNPVTLRAWQRRFGLINPARTPKGHRLYSEQDIARIEAILGWLAKGVSISRVKPLLEQDGSAGTNEAAGDARDDEWQQQRDILAQACLELNAGRLQSALDETSALYPFPVFFRHLLRPWLEQMGDLLVPEHGGEPLATREDAELITAWIQAQLGRRLHALAFTQKGPFKGQCLLFNFESSQWQSLLAGFELKAENLHWQCLDVSSLTQLPLVVDRLTFHALVLTVPADLPSSSLEVLARLQRTLDVPVVLYGQYASAYQALTELPILPPGQLSDLPRLIEESL